METNLLLTERKRLEEALRLQLSADDSLQELVHTIRQYKLIGGSQQDAMHVLEHLRDTISAEEHEDKILDLMDFVTGFCSAHMSIW
ncbi:hypothetical protein [Hymenobacter terrenus]|uniref:hypothetical protein n=1 Tax=Hymenobacter terrenus TaxID=1629124 RepID=UPI0012E0B6BE|nr:hypothetical protein [Hymenobacter terrenus]